MILTCNFEFFLINSTSRNTKLIIDRSQCGTLFPVGPFGFGPPLSAPPPFRPTPPVGPPPTGPLILPYKSGSDGDDFEE